MPGEGNDIQLIELANGWGKRKEQTESFKWLNVKCGVEGHDGMCARCWQGIRRHAVVSDQPKVPSTRHFSPAFCVRFPNRFLAWKLLAQIKLSKVRNTAPPSSCYRIILTSL